MFERFIVAAELSTATFAVVNCWGDSAFVVPVFDFPHHRAEVNSD
jgi:hypothetical protein